MWGEDLLKKYAEKMKDQKKDEEKDEDTLKKEEEERVRREKEFENSFPKFVICCINYNFIYSCGK